MGLVEKPGVGGVGLPAEGPGRSGPSGPLAEKNVINVTGKTFRSPEVNKTERVATERVAASVQTDQVSSSSAPKLKDPSSVYDQLLNNAESFLDDLQAFDSELNFVPHKNQSAEEMQNAEQRGAYYSAKANKIIVRHDASDAVKARAKELAASLPSKPKFQILDEDTWNLLRVKIQPRIQNKMASEQTKVSGQKADKSTYSHSTFAKYFTKTERETNGEINKFAEKMQKAAPGFLIGQQSVLKLILGVLKESLKAEKMKEERNEASKEHEKILNSEIAKISKKLQIVQDAMKKPLQSKL